MIIIDLIVIVACMIVAAFKGPNDLFFWIMAILALINGVAWCVYDEFFSVLTREDFDNIVKKYRNKDK